MTTRSLLIGQIQKPGQKPEDVRITVSERGVLTDNEAAAGLQWVNPRYDPGDARRYGLTGDGTDETTLLNNWLGSGEPHLKGEAGKTYKFTTALSIPNSTYCEFKGVTFELGASISGNTIAITVGTDCRIDELRVSVLTTFAVDRVIQIDDNTKIDYIHVESADQINNRTDSLDAAVIPLGNGIEIGSIYTKNYDNGVSVQSHNNITIGNIEVESYVRAVHVDTVDTFRCDSIMAHVKSVNASETAGHNGLLMEGVTDASFGTVHIQECGEHAVRFGSGAAANTDISIGEVHVKNCGQCGFKINDTNGAKRISVGLIHITDASAFTTTGSNEDTCRIEQATDVYIGKIVGDFDSNSVCGNDGLHINNCTRVGVGVLDVTNPANSIATIIDTNGANTDIQIGQVIGRGSANDGIVVDCSVTPSAMKHINVLSGYMRDITGTALDITASTFGEPSIFDFYVHSAGTLYSASTESAWIMNRVKTATPVLTTFTASDATPSVKQGNVFKTDTGTLTITDFDDGYNGQEITVISKGAITFDVTGTNLKGGTTDIVTANTDVTRWVCEDGTTWRLIGFMDASVDNSGGA